MYHAAVAVLPWAAGWLTRQYPTPESRKDLTIWLPTSRAAHPLAMALAAQGWVRLPQMRTLAMDDLTARQLGLHDDGPPVVGVTRQLAKVTALWQAQRQVSAREAAALAQGFISLHGRLVRQGLGWDDVRKATPPHLAQHWQIYADDLTVVGEAYARWLARENMRTQPQAAQVWLANLAAQVAEGSTPHVALGLTDVTPAGFGVLRGMAHHAQGHVLLPDTPLGQTMAARLEMPVPACDPAPQPSPTVALVEAATLLDEAHAVRAAVHEALALQRTPVAIVAANREVARHVQATLLAGGLVAQDSTGLPLPETPAGSLWVGFLQAVLTGDAVALAALGAHALVQPCEGWRAAAGALETALWRGTQVSGAWFSWRKAWAQVPYHPDRAIRAAGEQALPAWQIWDGLMDRWPTQPRAAALWLADAREALASLAPEWHRAAGAHDVEMWLAELGEVDEPLDGATLLALAETLAKATPVLPEAVMPEIQIWGEQEARLQQVGTLIVAGCNADVWPPKVDDPWLSQGQLQTLGLANNAHRAKVAAEDWQALMSVAPHIVFSRAVQTGGQSTLPSPLLAALLTNPDLATWRQAGATYVAWGKVATASVAATPAALVPEAAQYPSRWSISLVETARACPYKAMLGRVMQVAALPTFLPHADARQMGILLHDWVESLKHLPTARHDDAVAVEDHLLTHGRKLLARLPAATARMWQPRMPAMAKALAVHIARDARAGWVVSHHETTLEAPLADVTLTARVDLIQTRATQVRVVDVKTGQAPKAKAMGDGSKPQLPLAGWLASHTLERPCEEGQFWQVRGAGRTLVKADRHGGAAWADLQTDAVAGATETLTTLKPGAAWPAWPDREGGGFQPTGACKTCEFAGICRFKEWLS